MFQVFWKLFRDIPGFLKGVPGCSGFSGTVPGCSVVFHGVPWYSTVFHIPVFLELLDA